MTSIPPLRGDILDENGIPTLRFVEYLEGLDSSALESSIESIIAGLVAIGPRLATLDKRVQGLESAPLTLNAQLRRAIVDPPPVLLGAQVASLLKRVSAVENKPLVAPIDKSPKVYEYSTAVSVTTTGSFDEEIVRATNAVGTVTITLHPVLKGGNVTVIREGAGDVTIDGDGAETIIGETTQVMPSQYDVANLLGGGAEWVLRQ